jgi:hypothetical protein
VGLQSTADGSLVVLGNSPCIYSAKTSVFTQGTFPYYLGGTGVSVSADGNVLTANHILGDLSGNMLGSIAQPIPFYANSTNSFNPPNLLLSPQLNDSGSLLYLPYPNYFEIIDVAHAALRTRFSLTETITYTGSAIAIDSGGRNVYLITDKGLTVVDLGAAPLSIGHLSPQTAPAGTQIAVRGSGFDSTVTATVGGVAVLSISVNDENTLTLTLPSAPSGPQDIVLTRTSDGETYTLENGVVLP